MDQQQAPLIQPAPMHPHQKLAQGQQRPQRNVQQILGDLGTAAHAVEINYMSAKLRQDSLYANFKKKLDECNHVLFAAQSDNRGSNNGN